MPSISSRENGAEALENSASSAVEQNCAKRKLISEIRQTIHLRQMTQADAARICRTDPPTFSKVLRERLDSITIDRLTIWLICLGRPVEIRIGKLVSPYLDRAGLSVISSFEEKSR